MSATTSKETGLQVAWDSFHQRTAMRGCFPMTVRRLSLRAAEMTRKDSHALSPLDIPSEISNRSFKSEVIRGARGGYVQRTPAVRARKDHQGQRSRSRLDAGRQPSRLVALVKLTTAPKVLIRESSRLIAKGAHRRYRFCGWNTHTYSGRHPLVNSSNRK